MGDEAGCPPPLLGKFMKDNLMYEVVGDHIHVTDMVSGVILNQEDLYGMTVEDKRIRLPNGVVREPTWKFSEAYADVIVDQVMQGRTLSEITNMQGMPSYATIVKWKSEVPQFKERLSEARRSRAELFHDRVVDSLNESAPETPAEAQHAKLEFEKLKYLAEKNNPEEFGAKQTISGDKGNPIRIVVDTGIKRVEKEE